jgi:DNA-binding MurR/RpiR family transcriptional regulator
MTRLSSFRSRLWADFETLSPRLKEAARWVVDHPADVALLSTRQQARRAGVTPATLTRLGQRFGLAGYDGVRELHADAMRVSSSSPIAAARSRSIQRASCMRGSSTKR